MKTNYSQYFQPGPGWACALALALLLPVSARAAELSLTFGLYTSKKPTEMVKQYRPLLNAVETRLGAHLKQPVKIHMQVVKTYEEGMDGIVKGTFDFMQIGPASYVVAKERDPGIEILALECTKGEKLVNGIICVGSNSAVQTIADLKGRSFAFGDQFSTTGRYNSQLFLLENGVTAKDLTKFSYLERHDRVGAAVAAGEFDAGALNERTFKTMAATGSGLRALASFPIVGRPWISRSRLPAETRKALTAALVAITEPDVLSALGEKDLSFLEGIDADFTSTRKAVQENGRFHQ